MSSRFYSFMSRFEEQAIDALAKRMGKRSASADLVPEVLHIINAELTQGRLASDLHAYARLAIMLNPYSPQINTVFELHNKALRAIVETRMPGLTAIIRSCTEKNIPVPIIVSCEKYLNKALELQSSFKDRYFSITPIIVRGNLSLAEPTYDAEKSILTIQVADTYEALPVKIFELCAFFHAIEAKSGILKIDDDLSLMPSEPLDINKVATIFATTDYLGIPVRSVFHDRMWHVGKCQDRVPTVYGKPMISVWCRGAIYYLSHAALRKLAKHYFRFPSCLDGELYEDKAVGDVLYANGIMAIPLALETILGIDTTVAPERLIN